MSAKEGRDRNYQIAEMAKYDQLGPLSRAAIDYNPREIGIGRVLAAAPLDCIDIETMRWRDDRLAAWIRREIEAREHRPFDYFKLERQRAKTTIAPQ